MTDSAFGLRYFDEAREIRLMQIGGGGRILVEDASSKRRWWTRPDRKNWHVYATKDGHRYPTIEEAEEVARNLSA
jgi:hypothetical protein